MANIVPIPQLTFAPEAHNASGTRLPAPAGAASKFERLMYAPDFRTATSHGPVNGTAVGVRQYVEQLSHRWEAGQTALKRMTDAGQFTSKELVLTQMQMINCALDVEVSSKCASMFENGVQTLIQRGS